VSPDAGGDPLAFVFKTFADQYGAVSLFKVLSGTVHPDDHLTSTRSGTDERLHGLFTLRGRAHLPVDSVPAGDIAAVAKLTGTASGDTLAPRGRPVVVAPLDLPEPGFATAVVARTQSDDDKLSTALHRLVDEDPSLVLDRDDDSHQTILRGLGETHVQIALERLEDLYGVHVDAEEVRIPYRETITAEAEAEGRHKKQSGGHGQFGVCVLRVEPLGRGEGFEFVDKVVGGAIPKQFIPAVRKGVEETMTDGGLHGYPVVDVRVTCLDGKYHPVDSSEMAFKAAARLAFRDALAKAGPVVLEPLSRLEVTVPTDLQGDVIGHLNTHRARVQGTSAGGEGEMVVDALVPTSELTRYAVDLRSLSRGRGTFHAEHDHYDVLPEHLLPGPTA
jgi:elongation factor G